MHEWPSELDKFASFHHVNIHLYGVERQTKDKIRKAMHRIKRIVNIPKTNQLILKEAQNIGQKAIVEDGNCK